MKHYNPSITERANRTFNLKGGDSIPDEITGPVAVIEIAPRTNIIYVGSATNATNGSLVTLPNDKDFYLTAAVLTVNKDVTSTSILTQLTVVPDGGVSIALFSIAGITLTAQSETITLSLSHPIKLARGSQIQVTNSSAVANVHARANVAGYFEEVTRS
jgi:hypothetical protein